MARCFRIFGLKLIVGPPEMSETDNPAATATSAQQAEGAQYNAPFAVNISFPESVVIKMVDATALNDYEFGLFISSFFASAFVGFLVAYFQATTDAGLYRLVAAICGICAVAFFIWALMKRRRMTARSRAFKLKTSGVEEVRTD